MKSRNPKAAGNLTFIFDYDDTLAWNMHDFDRTELKVFQRFIEIFGIPANDHSLFQLEFAGFLIDELGHHAPYLPDIMNSMAEAERQNCGLPFRERFGRGCKDIYDRICNKSKLTPLQDNETKIWEISRRTHANFSARSASKNFCQETFVQNISNRQVQIDIENIKKMGFRMERFPTTFVQLYAQLCSEYNLPYSEEQKGAIYKMGLETFSEEVYRTKGLVSGAEETLSFLKSTGSELLIMTKGDKRVQALKFKAADICRWFEPENIFVVDDKTAKGMEELAFGRDRQKIIKVGNSLKSDIIPAVEAGFRAIHIPAETWLFEKSSEKIETHVFDGKNPIDNSKQVIEISKITDIIDIYSQLRT